MLPEMRTSKELKGRNLLQVAMPIGGIGAGCICLNGYGGLQDFSIRHAPAVSAMPDRHQPQDAAFGIIYFPESGDTRLLEGPLPPEKIYNLGLKSQGFNGGGYEGLPRFRNCGFTGEYPFGRVNLSDPELPLDITITGFNPLIPLDDKDSGIPSVILDYRLHNPTNKTVPYQFSYHLSHLAWKGAEVNTCSEAIPGLGIYYWNTLSAESPSFGNAALGILDADPVIKARWLRGGWFDAVSALWREVSKGYLTPIDGMKANEKPARDGGSVLISGEIDPSEEIVHPIVITWYFPNITAGGAINNSIQGKNTWHPFYSTLWNDAREVLFYVKEHYHKLRSRTLAFHKALFSSSLPDVVLDAVSANLAIFKSPTVMRHESGDLWGWEGCFCDAGCCPGSCTHVWNYAQSIPHLFPALERTLRERELIQSMDARGHINFRASPPGVPTSHDYHAAADGQLGGIMKVYREWQISGDREWLISIYPYVKRSMDYCIQQWDPRQTGLIEEPHHNTYDIEFWGPDGLCCSFYISALTAMSRLAMDMGHAEDATKYEDLAQKGAQAIETRLFNGEYYEQQIMVDGLRDKPLFIIEEEDTEETRLHKLEGPKYQIGTGCLSDGVFGAWLAKLCGIETPQNRASVRSHLSSVFRNNFQKTLWKHVNPQRPGYALGDEPGLILCTWPHGGRPTLPFVYCDEVWTGIEYQVASHLISEGMLSEGLTLVEGVRSRYDGYVRNPWNEYECGSYYARAMSSYALLIALSGFHYSVPTRVLKIFPKMVVEPFTCFFSMVSCWGVFKLQADRLEIELTEGYLTLDEVQISYQGKTWQEQVHTTIQAGEAYKIELT